MSVVTKLTEEEFLALPDERGKQELLDGQLITLPPAIVSPANTDEEIGRKVQAYLEDGAAEVWVVRPATSSMTVFKQGDPASVRYTGVYRYEPASLDVNVQQMIHGV